MKNVFLRVSVLSVILVLASCGPKKQDVTKQKGVTKVILPCTGSKYNSNKKNFRANGMGESMNQMTAKKKALSNVRSLLAQSISATMKIVSDNYVKSSEFNNVEEVLSNFEQEEILH